MENWHLFLGFGPTEKGFKLAFFSISWKNQAIFALTFCFAYNH